MQSLLTDGREPPLVQLRRGSTDLVQNGQVAHLRIRRLR